MIPTSLYHRPRFLLTALPPSPQPVPSTHAPSRNHVCSLRRSITEYSLELFMEQASLRIKLQMPSWNQRLGTDLQHGQRARTISTFCDIDDLDRISQIKSCYTSQLLEKGFDLELHPLLESLQVLVRGHALHRLCSKLLSVAPFL